MTNRKKPRPKTKAQMRKLVEDIVLTEEDEKLLDSVWDSMRRDLKRKRMMEQRKKAALKNLSELAKEYSGSE